jgi:YD repeat-containing protein
MYMSKGEHGFPAKELQVIPTLAKTQPNSILKQVTPRALLDAAVTPAPPFTECPAIGADTSCGILIEITNTGTNVFEDPSEGPFDGDDDTLTGVINDSTEPLSSIALSGTTDLFGFDGDGICSGDYGAWDGSTGCPYGSTGYEGPNTSFSDINADASGGLVNFPTALAPGGSAYFSLEEALTASTVVSGGPTAGEQGGAPNGSEHFTVCQSSSPVNCATGEFWHEFTDFNIPGRGVPLDFTRTYTSGNASTNGPLGFGWTDSYNWSLSVDPSGDVTVNQDDGSTVSFTDNAGTYVAPPRVLASLVMNSDRSYTFTQFANGIAYNFSSAGVLQTEVDRNGYVTTLNYTGAQLTSVTDPVGRTLSFTYTSTNIAQITDPMGRTEKFSYDSSGDLIKATDPLGHTWTFTYDSNHLLLTMTDPNGGVVTNTYNSSNQVIKQANPLGHATTWAFTGDPMSPVGGTTTITDTHGNVTVENYSNLELTSVTTAAGTTDAATTTYTYDPATLGITSVTDPNGHVTTYTYDADGNQLTSTDALANTSSFSYNALNETASATTPLGETTSYSYDSNGNLLSTTSPSGGTTTLSYGDATHPGDATSSSDPDGHITSVTYDSQGDEASVSTSPSSGVTDTTQFVYDLDGEKTCTASANAVASGIACPSAGSPRVAGTTSETYNADGELTASTDASGGATAYSYDSDGNTLQTTNPDGNTIKTTFDLLDRPLSTTTGANGSSPMTTTDDYDLSPGTLPCLSTVAEATYCNTTDNAAGGTTTSYYDVANKLIEETLPGGSSTQFTYDLAGDNLTKVNAIGGTTSYSYDADSRITGISYSDGLTPNVTYTFDADGQRASLVDGTGTTTYSYDSDGHLLSTTDGAGATVSYSYDAAGDVTTITYPDGRMVGHTYNGANQLSAISDGGGNTTSFSFDHSGNLTSTVYPNGDTVSATYGANDLMVGTSVSPTSSPSTVLAAIAYSRDSAGQITKEADSGALTGTTDYAYDAASQLTTAGSSTYAYDSVGDLVSLPGGVTQTFNTAQELTSSVSGGGTTDYTYDGLGELTKAIAPGATTTYGYNQASELTAFGSMSTAAPPSVSKISPTSGPAGGGITVTITGSGFTGASVRQYTRKWLHRRQQYVGYGHLPGGNRHGGCNGDDPDRWDQRYQFR